jgi:hypothetical protein
MRPDPASVVQKVEAGIAAGASITIALPILLEADGETILRARAALEPSLDQLREAILDAIAALGDPALEPGARAAVRAAAAEYQAAFDTGLPQLAASVPDDEPRLVSGLVSLTLGSFPADVALRATAAATRRLGGAAVARAAAAAEAHAAPAMTDTDIALRDPLAGAHFRSVVVRLIARG